MKNIFSVMRDLSEYKPAGKNKAGVKGYVEQMDGLQIIGWAIDENKNQLKLSLRIDNTSYPIEPAWHERTDVAAQFGDEFVRCGFAIEVPSALADLFQRARQNAKRIDIIANNVALPNRTNAAQLKNGAKGVRASADASKGGELISKLMPKNTLADKKKTGITGYVERIENLRIHGWAIDSEKSALKFSLDIDGDSHPVVPAWSERSDIAAQFGESFLRSGFTIEVPEALIDEFLLARQGNQRIEIVVNGITLPGNVKRLNLKTDAGLKSASKDFSYRTIADINARFGIEVTSSDFNNLLEGRVRYPLRIDENDTINANYYHELARQNLIRHDIEAARHLLRVCLTFEKRAEFLELLANTYLEQNDYETAAAHYKMAIASEGTTSKWLFSNLANCEKHLSHIKKVVETLLRGIEKNPEFGQLYSRLDELVFEYWLKQQGALEALAIVDDRAGLIAKMAKSAAFIYQTYLRAYGASEHPKSLGSCNLQRILIVGDMHIPQCVRYRIDQKIEQLESLGKNVTAISWTDLAKEQNILAFHDVVIFYRVPAEPQVLKAMAQVNATGKLSLYEIDDLLFDPSYPPAIETYGGYLDLNIYIQILKGMASFNAAARYCRFGIASTQPLADKLQAMVFGGRCFVHRNGLDSLNLFKQKAHDAGKATVDIFYGSGTMAHNSDFTDLALPALDRILAEYPQVNLLIAGYLKLPSAFLARYGDRVKQMLPVKSVKAYWSLLELGDINLAVLHDDEINGCKSELKWFEAACLGIPSVMSTTANYRDVIKQGEDGFMAATTDEWYRHLKTLVERPEERQAMAEKALARVKSEYSIEALARNISDVLEQALAHAQGDSQAVRKKIALINVFFPPQSIGGATRVIADNFELLQKDYRDQFELSVFTTDADHKPPYQMTVYNHQNARVYRATALWRERMDWHSQDEKMGELFSAYLEAEKPDLIHFHCIQRLTGAVVEAAIEAKIPYIVTVHDAWWISDYQFLVDADNTVYPEGHPDPFAPYTPPPNVSLSDSLERMLYLKDLLHGAYKVLAVSNSFADIYRKNGVPQVQVNKNGISDLMPWQLKDTRHTEKVVCAHVGGMAEHKGYFLLKRAIAELQPRNIEMLIVDHSKEEGYHAQDYWGDVPVTFIGRLSQARIVDLYRQIDVLAAPSTWPESYGLVTREAAACGCWVIASNMGGIGEDVIDGQSGFVIEPAVEPLVACLQKIDDNPAQFKGPASPPELRRVTEQVKELTAIYSTQDF